MKNKKQTTESVHQEENWAQATYRTGSTQPPKSHGGIIAFLLVLVIFLCGISTALGLMNIQLLDALKQSDRETAPVAFSEEQAHTPADHIRFSPGFYGEEIPEFWCVYQDLPRGIYITDVIEGCDAAAKGMLPGDILTALDGEAVTTAQQLTALLETKQAPVQVTLYREGQKIELTLKMEN